MNATFFRDTWIIFRRAMALSLRQPLWIERYGRRLDERFNDCLGIGSRGPSIARVAAGPSLVRVQRALHSIQCTKRGEVRRRDLQLLAQVLQQNAGHVIQRR